MELQPLGARRFLHVSDNRFPKRKVWIDEQGYHLGVGQQVGEQFEPLGMQVVEQEADTGDVAARSRETGDQVMPTVGRCRS